MNRLGINVSSSKIPIHCLSVSDVEQFKTIINENAKVQEIIKEASEQGQKITLKVTLIIYQLILYFVIHKKLIVLVMYYILIQ